MGRRKIRSELYQVVPVLNGLLIYSCIIFLFLIIFNLFKFILISENLLVILML